MIRLVPLLFGSIAVWFHCCLVPLLFGSIAVWFHYCLVPLLVGLEGGFERMV